MNFNNKIYRSQSFVDRIQMNLANVSSNSKDEFQLINAYYDPKFFDCQLCDHKGCAYAYEIKNLETDQILKVGSECINHFKDKGVDIDLAESLMKRVMSATNKARHDLKKQLGQKAWDTLSDEKKKEIGYKRHIWVEGAGKEAYKALSNEEKRELIVNQFMFIQAKELLTQVAWNKHYLDENEIKKIIDLGLVGELAKAEKQRSFQMKVDEKKNVLKEVDDYIKFLEKNWEEVDVAKVNSLKIKFESVKNPWDTDSVSGIFERYLSNLADRKEHAWLLNYLGQDQTVKNIQTYYETYGFISENQKQYALKIISGNEKPIDGVF